jgi:acyl-CoA dehydrogenase
MNAPLAAPRNARLASLIARTVEAAKVAAQHADDVDAKSRFPKEAIAALAERKLLSAMIPERFGGDGASMADIGELCAILAQSCASTAMIFSMHQIKASSLVAHGEGAPWHENYMRDVAAKQLLLGSATTEGGIGGDLRNSICAVEVNGDRMTLTKNATCISYGDDSDAILVTARRSPDAQSSDQVMVVLRKQDYTLEKTSKWDALGMRGTCSDGYVLRSEAAAEQILPLPFADIAAQSMLAAAHLLWASLWFGIANGAMAKAQNFVRSEARKNPAVTPPGGLRLAEAACDLQAMRSVILDGFRRYEAAHADPDDLGSVSFLAAMNTVKLNASTMMNDILRQALMITGIHGYRNDSPYSLGRSLRDAMSAPIMISNDRILGNTARLLLAHRFEARLTV